MENSIQLDDTFSIEKLDELIQLNKESRNYIECLSHIEKCIVLKAKKFGTSNPEFLKSAKDLCEVCNLIAFSYLENNKKEEGLTYLLRAEKLFKNYKELLNLCYNNIGCYYKL